MLDDLIKRGLKIAPESSLLSMVALGLGRALDEVFRYLGWGSGPAVHGSQASELLLAVARPSVHEEITNDYNEV